MDKRLIRHRFSKASDTYTEHADVQRQVAGKMVRLLEQYIPHSCHANVLEVGCGTGLFTRLYLEQFHPERFLLNDICPEMEVCFGDILDEHTCFCAGDAETIPFPSGQNLIVSCSAVQWFDSLPRFFKRCSGLLKPESYLSFSTFGRKNLHEVASLTGCSLAYLSLDELKELLTSDYEIVHSEEEIVRLTFSTPMDVLKHLQNTGVTGVCRKQWTKGGLADFCTRYRACFRDDEGSVSLTYYPIYIIVKKKKQ